jgi:hypothetical protein
MMNLDDGVGVGVGLRSAADEWSYEGASLLFVQMMHIDLGLGRRWEEKERALFIQFS